MTSLIKLVSDGLLVLVAYREVANYVWCRLTVNCVTKLCKVLKWIIFCRYLKVCRKKTKWEKFTVYPFAWYGFEDVNKKMYHKIFHNQLNPIFGWIDFSPSLGPYNEWKQHLCIKPFIEPKRNLNNTKQSVTIDK